MHHMGVTFDYHLIYRTYAARLANPPQVIAARNNQHQMLGNLLPIDQQFCLKRLIFLLGCAASAGAGDRSNGEQPPSNRTKI